MKPFVSVIAQGVNRDAVIEPSNPNNDIIHGSDFSLLQGFQLRGATGPGAAAIRVTNTPLDRFEVGQGGVFNCNRFFVVDSSTSRANLRINKLTTDITDNTVRGLEIISGVGGSASALFTNVGFRITGDANLTEATLISGTNASFIIDQFLYIGRSVSNGGPTPAPAMVVENGATLTTLAGFVENFDINLLSRNVGSGPSINVLATSFQGSGTRDISIEHPGTTGSLFTKAQQSKTFVDPVSPIGMLYFDPIDEGLISAGPLFLGKTHNVVSDVLDLILRGGMMGRIAGGGLSKAGGLDVDVAEGFGYLMISADDHPRVEWSATTLTLPPATVSWIFVNNMGVVTFSASRPNSMFNIILGRSLTTPSTVGTLETVLVNAHHSGNRYDDTLRLALGPVYASGSLVIENPLVDRELNVGSGSYFVSMNQFTPSGGSPISFSESFHVSGSFIGTPPTQTVVNNTDWDDGTDLVPLTAGFYAKHSLYVSGDGPNEIYILVISQAEYPDLVTAEAADIPLPPATFDGGNIVLLANIIVQEGNNSIVEIQDARPIIGFRPSGVTATAQHGNLFGLLDDDHPQYLLVDGTRAMIGNLNMGNNNITNVNLVDGVNVSDHQTRHLPNGADPITTAAPTNPLSATTSNAVGIQNSLSRSDHGHAISTGAPSATFGPDSTNSTGTAVTLARSDHGHQFSTATAVTLSPSSVNGIGAANSFCKKRSYT
jgi:hypothetical protein